MSIFSVSGPRRCWRCKGKEMMFAQSITQVKVAARRRIRTGVRSVGREYFCCACGFVVFIYRGN